MSIKLATKTKIFGMLTIIIALSTFVISMLGCLFYSPPSLEFFKFVPFIFLFLAISLLCGILGLLEEKKEEAKK